MARDLRSVLAAGLAPLAVLAVAVSGISAGVVYSAEPDGTDESETQDPAPPANSDVRVPEGMQVLDGSREYGARLLVPDATGWDVTDSDFYTIGYMQGGREGATVTSPATYEQGWCDDLDPQIPQAFIGFAEPVDAEGTTPEETARDVLGVWTDNAQVQDDGTRADVTEASTASVELDDGTSAGTSAAFVLAEPDPDECDSGPVQIRTLSIGSGDEMATVVLVRNVTPDGGDVEGGLSTALADDILRTTVAR